MASATFHANFLDQRLRSSRVKRNVYVHSTMYIVKNTMYVVFTPKFARNTAWYRPKLFISGAIRSTLILCAFELQRPWISPTTSLLHRNAIVVNFWTACLTCLGVTGCWTTNTISRGISTLVPTNVLANHEFARSFSPGISHIQNQWLLFTTYPQWIAPTGMKKPLENPATAAMTGERRSALIGKAQMRAISRAIHVWFRQMLTTRTCRYTRKLYALWLISCKIKKHFAQ